MMRAGSWAAAVFGVVLCGRLLSAEPVQQCLRSSLPANVELTHDLDRVLQRLHDRSATFRTQCERLGRAPHLRVTIHLNTSLPSRCRAFTTVRRHGRQIRADVNVPPSSALSELVAHEFEHLLEQIEGLDLRVLARTRESGVREVERELFETDRAIRVGRIVAAEEVDAIRRPHTAD
jgi:hypothetical protein